IASMVASLGGLDALVFTGGVGERSAPVRAMTADGLAFLGVAVDAAANAAANDAAGEAHGEADTEITAGDATARTFVVAAREDIEIAREVREIISG
ncbi:MAG: acetate/propionate family kinase, partial [Candidatus Limnocylindrales bacterium]